MPKQHHQSVTAAVTKSTVGLLQPNLHYIIDVNAFAFGVE